jgi:hypothetical protein
MVDGYIVKSFSGRRNDTAKQKDQTLSRPQSSSFIYKKPIVDLFRKPMGVQG